MKRLGQLGFGGMALALCVGYALYGAPQGASVLHGPAQEPSLTGDETRLVPGAVYRATRVSDANESRESLAVADTRALGREHLDVVVRGTSGEPVPAARIELESRTATAVFSDAEGRARLSFDAADGDQRLRVSADGYAVHVSSPAFARDEDHVVQLRDAAELSGTVAWAGGVAAPAETVVLAWPRGDEPTLAEVERVKAGGFSAGLFVTHTDVHGRFRFTGLTRTEVLEVSAVRDGAAVLERARGVVPGRADVDLTLHALVAAAVELVDEEGGAPRAGAGLFEGSALWDPVEAQHHPRFLPEGAAELAWLGGEDLHRISLGGRDRFLMIYETHRRDAWSAANGTFSITVPGYEPVWTSVPLAPLSSDLAIRELPLKRVAESYAPLEVELRGVEGWIAEGARRTQRSFATLRLHREGAGAPLEVALPSSHHARWTVEGVPTGRYMVTLALRDWNTTIPSEHGRAVWVDVDERGGFASLHLEEHGAGEVLVSQADGSDYEGELLLLLQKDGPANYVHFEKAPYVLAGLEEGEYEISVRRAGGDLLDEEPSSRLWLAANTVTACMIHLQQ